MSATLTVNLDADLLQLAEQEAKARHTTLPEVVAHQLRVMTRNWQDSRAGKTPVTEALRGAVKLPPDFDERMALTEELRKRQGVQGWNLRGHRRHAGSSDRPPQPFAEYAHRLLALEQVVHGIQLFPAGWGA